MKKSGVDGVVEIPVVDAGAQEQVAEIQLLVETSDLAVILTQEAVVLGTNLGGGADPLELGHVSRHNWCGNGCDCRCCGSCWYSWWDG